MKNKINETLAKEFITEVVKLLSEKRFTELGNGDLYSIAVQVIGWEREGKEPWGEMKRQVSVIANPEYPKVNATDRNAIRWNVKMTEDKRKNSVIEVN